MKYTCPCCGYKTLPEEPPDTYNICKICGWEDDGVQFYKPDFGGGANKVSLKQGQKNFIELGYADEDYFDQSRKPRKEDIKDLDWKPFD